MPPNIKDASITWIHPALTQQLPATTINDPDFLSRIPQIFPGYDGPPPNTQPGDPPMYDLVLAINRPDGGHTDIKVYLPRRPIFPGMWRHPGGQLSYFDDPVIDLLISAIAPRIPPELRDRVVMNP